MARLIALQGWAQQLESGSLLRGAVRPHISPYLPMPPHSSPYRLDAVRLDELLNPNHKPNPNPHPHPHPNPNPNPNPNPDPNPNPNPNPDPDQVRLSELLNPGFFLTALRQQTARVSQLPMDGTHRVSNPNSNPNPNPNPNSEPEPEPGTRARTRNPNPNPSPNPNPNPSPHPYPKQACTSCAH